MRVSETILLTSWPQQTVENVGALTDENLPWLANTKAFARIIGMFVGGGSYGSGIHTKHTWAINNSDLEMLERYKKMCIQTFNHDFVINICTCGVHKLVPTEGEYGSVRDFAFRFEIFVTTIIAERKYLIFCMLLQGKFVLNSLVVFMMLMDIKRKRLSKHLQVLEWNFMQLNARPWGLCVKLFKKTR